MELQLERILAAGTYGWVCVVHDRTRGEQLAAKVLREEHVQNPKAVSRMRDEARLLANLDHPNIVRVYGIEEIDGRPVLLLEYVEGAPLDELLGTQPQGLPAPEAIEIARQTHEALHAAWRTPDRDTGQPVRVIHRDIKPGNLMLSSQGHVKVLDFGIAHGEMAGKESITVSMVLGAHGYLAPERLDGEEDRIEGDVYAMGLVLYELLIGKFMKLSLQQRNHSVRLDQHMHALQIQGADTWTRQAIVDLNDQLVGPKGLLTALPEGDAMRVWSNYQMVGGLWTKNGAASGSPPVPSAQGPANANSPQRGSLELANTTMETYEQGPGSYVPNCFGCHNFDPKSPLQVSHIAASLLPSGS